MFIQVMQGRVNDAAGVRQEFDRWGGQLGAAAPGWLGLTAGVADGNQLVAVFRFDDQASATANDERPEVAAWRASVEKRLGGPPRVHRCPIVRAIKGGDSDKAGFVRVVQAKVIDARRLAALQSEVERGLLDEGHVLGVTVAHHDEGGWFTEITYFTSERAVRAAEREMPVDKAVQLGMVRSYMESLELFELRTPWLQSPGREPVGTA
ncbi:MAG TPA: hypothetical protein VG276_04270 [Actinomycetes bacterium]|jgi:hypothetical protein|nr:hypothetical protein [Actinomycetes bacterium]